MFYKDYGETIIYSAEKGFYLALKGKKNSEEIIGKPERIIFHKSDKTPEMIEKSLEN